MLMKNLSQRLDEKDSNQKCEGQKCRYTYGHGWPRGNITLTAIPSRDYSLMWRGKLPSKDLLNKACNRLQLSPKDHTQNSGLQLNSQINCREQRFQKQTHNQRDNYFFDKSAEVLSTYLVHSTLTQYIVSAVAKG